MYIHTRYQNHRPRGRGFRLNEDALTASAVLLVSLNKSAELLQTALGVARLLVPPTFYLSGSSRIALGGEEMYLDLQGNGEPPCGFGAFHADVVRCLFYVYLW